MAVTWPWAKAKARRGLPAALWLWVVGWALTLASAAAAVVVVTPYPPSARQDKAYGFGRSFLGLDKCNACVGTSICKKLFKEDIR